MTTTENESEPKPRRGRPRDLERCRRILEAARAHFYAHGLERASVEGIASDAGVSKMTVYSHFRSKEGLFEAVVRERTGHVVGGNAGDEAPDPTQPQKALLAIGEQFLTLTRESADAPDARRAGEQGAAPGSGPGFHGGLRPGLTHRTKCGLVREVARAWNDVRSEIATVRPFRPATGGRCQIVHLAWPSRKGWQRICRDTGAVRFRAREWVRVGIQRSNQQIVIP